MIMHGLGADIPIGLLWVVFYLIGGSSDPNEENFCPLVVKVIVTGLLAVIATSAMFLWLRTESPLILGGLGLVGWGWAISGLIGFWNEMAGDFSFAPKYRWKRRPAGVLAGHMRPRQGADQIIGAALGHQYRRHGRGKIVEHQDTRTVRHDDQQITRPME